MENEEKLTVPMKAIVIGIFYILTFVVFFYDMFYLGWRDSFAPPLNTIFNDYPILLDRQFMLFLKTAFIYIAYMLGYKNQQNVKGFIIRKFPTLAIFRNVYVVSIIITSSLALIFFNARLYELFGGIAFLYLLGITTSFGNSYVKTNRESLRAEKFNKQSL